MSKVLTLFCCLTILAVCIASDPGHPTFEPNFDLDEADANVDGKLVDDNSTDPSVLGRVYKKEDLEKLSANLTPPNRPDLNAGVKVEMAELPDR